MPRGPGGGLAMRRYRRRDYAIAFLLIGAPALLGSTSLLDELADRVALIEQFLTGPGAPPVVVDANGEVVGSVIGTDYFAYTSLYTSVVVDRFPSILAGEPSRPVL